MSRNFLISLIVIAGALLAWLIVEEKQRSKTLVTQANEIFTLPETVSATTTTSVTTPSTSTITTPQATSETTLTSSTIQSASNDLTPTSTTNPRTTNTVRSSEMRSAPTPLSNTSATLENELLTSQSSSASSKVQEESASPVVAVNKSPTAPEASTTSETATEVAACSSFDEAGLLATFDGALANFIADATATYGNQYENLQYQLSSKSSVIEGEQGVVTTSYSGTVQELSTGQAVSANGIIRATFLWDGCTWQVVDYSF